MTKGLHFISTYAVMLLTLFMSSCHEEPTYPLLLVDADTLLMRGDYGKTDSLLTIFDNSYTKQEKAVLHYRQLLQIGRRFVEDELTADEKFCQLMDSKSFITRGEGNSSLSIKTQEFDMQFQQFLSQHDLTVDLTPTERKSLTLAENDWMTLIADEDAFLTYISENKTPQFQKIFDKIISGNISTITINSIIQDKGLKLNEKLLLTIQLDIALNTPINLQSVNQTVSICDKRYARAVHSCQIQFATAIAGAVATSIASGGLGLFTGGVAVVNYFNCIDNANDSYEDCIKDHAK